MSPNALLDISLRISAVILASWLVVRLLRRQSAAIRHGIWLAALLVTLLAIPVYRFAPHWTTATTSSVPLPQEVPAVASATHFVADRVPHAKPPQTEIPWFELGWALGGVTVAVHWITAYARLIRLAKRGGVVRTGRTRVLVSCIGPLTFGWLNPTVLLPEESALWPEERLEAILHHEQAHVDRADWLTLSLARLACTIFWFNPLVWVLAHELRRQAEFAADDLALSSGNRPSDYAQQLLIIAAPGRSGSLAAADGNGLSERIEAVLDPARRRGALTKGHIAALMGIIALGATTMAQTSEPHSPTSLPLSEGSRLQGSGVSIPALRIYAYRKDGDLWTTAGVEAWDFRAKKVAGDLRVETIDPRKQNSVYKRGIPYAVDLGMSIPQGGSFTYDVPEENALMGSKTLLRRPMVLSEKSDRTTIRFPLAKETRTFSVTLYLGMGAWNTVKSQDARGLGSLSLWKTLGELDQNQDSEIRLIAQYSGGKTKVMELPAWRVGPHDVQQKPHALEDIDGKPVRYLWQARGLRKQTFTDLPASVQP